MRECEVARGVKKTILYIVFSRVDNKLQPRNRITNYLLLSGRLDHAIDNVAKVCGSGSVVERCLAKANVASSNLVSRSKYGTMAKW